MTTAPPTSNWREEMARLEVPPARFCTTSDGVRIAYNVAGHGPALLSPLSPQFTNCQTTWKFPMFRSCLDQLYRCNTLYSFDWRNTGLSERTGEDFSIETAPRDVEAVVNATGQERVSIRMNGDSHFGVIPYAVAHPERIHRLATLNVNLRPVGERDAIGQLPAANIMHDSANGRQLMARIIAGWGNHEVAEQWKEYLESTATAEYQGRTFEICAGLDVSDLVPLVQAPTLVVQRRELTGPPTVADAMELAALFPNGYLRIVEGTDLDVSSDEDATAPTLAFLNERIESPHGSATIRGRSGDGALSDREVEVLTLIAAGKTNPEIAEALTIAPATASKHVHHILEKLGMSRRSEAAAYALRAGLVE